MGRYYARFIRKGLSLAPLGVEQDNGREAYFCTPKGAEIFGWAGVDGIHYCFVRGFGEMVFAVSPMNGVQDCVHPIARDFRDFLRLLLACGDAAALEQAWQWDEGQFDAFVRENQPSPEQKQTLEQLAAVTKLDPMPQPWKYIHALQAEFDGSRLKYPKEYYDLQAGRETAAPEWRVWYGENFWHKKDRRRSGQEQRLNAEFQWAGRQWIVPACYICSEGLVLDICMRVEPEEMQAFTERFQLINEDGTARELQENEYETLDRENPCSFDISPRLMLNGRPLQEKCGCGVVYFPPQIILPGEEIEAEAQQAVERYGLDASAVWAVKRCSFPWATKRRPQLRTLQLTMEQQAVPLQGTSFTVHQPGDCVQIVHPVTGQKYTLTVQELEQSTCPEWAFGDTQFSCPTHFTAMSYTVEPSLPPRVLQVMDSAKGDRPVAKQPPESRFAPEASNHAAIAIIGGADGPTAVAVSSGGRGNVCTACSSLYFQPAKEIRWRTMFHVRQYEEKTVTLL